jgi:4'-phosphopantetheinyl transferase
MLTLPLGEIHLWFVFQQDDWTDILAAHYRTLLTEEERHRELRFRSQRDQRQYLLTRSMVRVVLSRYSSTKPAAWRFTKSTDGRPHLHAMHPEAATLSFNISHTNGLILIGVTRGHTLGVDTECLDDESSVHIANRFFSPAEVCALKALPLHAQGQRFFEYWTLKESYIKARGEGLALALAQFTFEFQGESTIHISFCEPLKDIPARWRFWLLQPSPNYIASVCVQKSVGLAQRLVARKLVPPGYDEPFHCGFVRTSD